MVSNKRAVSHKCPTKPWASWGDQLPSPPTAKISLPVSLPSPPRFFLVVLLWPPKKKWKVNGWLVGGISAVSVTRQCERKLGKAECQPQAGCSPAVPYPHVSSSLVIAWGLLTAGFFIRKEVSECELRDICHPPTKKKRNQPGSGRSPSSTSTLYLVAPIWSFLIQKSALTR